MSFVGFDLGNESCVVAVARWLGEDLYPDVVLIDESKRETPAAVRFDDKQRLFGMAAASSSINNRKNTVSHIKRLLGRRFSDLEQELPFLPFKVTEGTDGYPLVHVSYLSKEEAFTPTQLLGMLLSNLKVIAEKEVEAPVQDCCIGIPAHFTQLQRSAVMDAAKIAGLTPVCLLHETTAAALDYSFVPTNLPSEKNQQVNVAFVDVGHASTQVSVAGIKKGELSILSHAFDQSLGGRDFDEFLFWHFAATIKEEYEIDVYQSERASLMLRDKCRKMKETLTSTPTASLDIDFGEKNVRGSIKREEFEQLITELLERLKVPLETTLSDANLSVDKIQSFVLVGAGSRVPAIVNTLAKFFGKKPRRTIVASECIACGCALQCAILKSTSKVPPCRVCDIFPFPIALSWTNSTLEAENGGIYNSQTKIVFPKGDPIQSFKSLTYYGSNAFSVDAMYADASKGKIRTYLIGPFQSSEGEAAKVVIKVHLNLHGIFSVESATMWDSKKNVKRTNVPITEHVHGGMLPEDFQKALERERTMTHQDKEMEEIIAKKNDVESYVINMKCKLKNFQKFLTNSEKKRFIAKLKQLKASNSEDETKDVYIVKLEELRKLEEILHTQAMLGLQHQLHEAQDQIKNTSNHVLKLEDQLKAAHESSASAHKEAEEARRECENLKESTSNLKTQLINTISALDIAKYKLNKAQKDLSKAQAENEGMGAIPTVVTHSVVDRFEQRLRAAEEASRAAQDVANAAATNCHQVRLDMEELQRVPWMNPEVMADLQEQLAAERNKIEQDFNAERLNLQTALSCEKREREKLDIEKIFYSSMAIGNSSEKEKELLIQLRKVQKERATLQAELCASQAYIQRRKLPRFD